MDSMNDIYMKAPPIAYYYSDITKGYYFLGGITEQWHVYNPKLGWVMSAHGEDTPRGLIPLFEPEENPCKEIPKPEFSQLRGRSVDTVIVDGEVNQPSHYKRKSSDVLRTVRRRLLEDGDVQDLECIEAMLSHFSTVDQIRGYLRGNSFKYRWRYEDKEPIRSLKSAAWYESKLLELEEIVEEYSQ